MLSLKTDRKREVQKISELEKFVKMYGERSNDFWTNRTLERLNEFWTGGQTELSLEKNKRIWVWRSSQKELNVNEMEGKRASIPSAQPNYCASVSIDGEKGNLSCFD